jgi:hypothetical protein
MAGGGFCLVETAGQPSDADLWLGIVGPVFGQSGAALSWPRPTLRPRAWGALRTRSRAGHGPRFSAGWTEMCR